MLEATALNQDRGQQVGSSLDLEQATQLASDRLIDQTTKSEGAKTSDKFPRLVAESGVLDMHEL